MPEGLKRQDRSGSVGSFGVAGPGRGDSNVVRSSTFEVDCGDVLSGHRLVVTGLRVDGTSDDPVHADYSQHREGKPVHPMVSLTYRIEPVLPFLVPTGRDLDARIRLDPPADPTWWPPVISPGAEREDRAGARVTRGAFGPFVCPEGTRQVEVSLTEVGIASPRAPHRDHGPDRELGVVLVDPVLGLARWLPAAAP